MSTKWLIAWLIGFFFLSIVTGYLFIALRGEEKKTVSSQDAKFDYKVDPVTVKIFGKTIDEDGIPALKVYFTAPPGSPLYETRATITLNCSLRASSLVSRERIVKTEIDVYENAQMGDSIVAFCQDEYCYEIGGECSLKRPEM